MSLTPSERHDIESAKAAIRAAGPLMEPDRAEARQVVQIFRETFPDLDEVTIGRVLMLAAAVSGRFDDTRAVGNVLTPVAIDLTASEQ